MEAWHSYLPLSLCCVSKMENLLVTCSSSRMTVMADLPGSAASSAPPGSRRHAMEMGSSPLARHSSCTSRPQCADTTPSPDIANRGGAAATVVTVCQNQVLEPWLTVDLQVDGFADGLPDVVGGAAGVLALVGGLHAPEVIGWMVGWVGAWVGSEEGGWGEHAATTIFMNSVKPV